MIEMLLSALILDAASHTPFSSKKLETSSP
jgi:hypothetical protein